MAFQKKPTKMTNVLGDFLADILKAVIANIIAGILCKYAKKGLNWITPFLIKSRFLIALYLHVFALKLHIGSGYTFIVAFFTLAYKSATKEQKVAIRQIMSDAFSHEASIQ